jgi:hypothetical protein
MSMDICSKCDKPVDTDFDLDCYESDKCICEACREFTIELVEKNETLN